MTGVCVGFTAELLKSTPFYPLCNCLVRYLTYYIYFALFSLLICVVSDCVHTVGGSS